MLQAFPAEAPALLEPALLQLLSTVLAGKLSGVVLAAAFGVFSRLLLHVRKPPSSKRPLRQPMIALSCECCLK